MIKGIPLFLIGIGIITSFAFTLYSLTVNPEYPLYDFDLISDYDIQLIGIVFGGVLMGLGGLKFILEKQQISEDSELKKVSLFWQVVGSAIPGFDLFVMYRIQKLRLGSLVFASQFVIFTVSLHSGVSSEIDTNIGLLVGIGYAIVVYIWSKRWNEQFRDDLQTNNEKSIPRRGKLLLSVSGGLFFLTFVLFSAHAVIFMDTWEELGLQEEQEGVRNSIFSIVPHLFWIDLSLIGSLILAPIIGIIGGIIWFKERKQKMNIDLK